MAIQYPIGKDFIELAQKVLPQHEELVELVTPEMTASEIDETIYRHGEYRGGMAAALIGMLRFEDGQ